MNNAFIALGSNLDQPVIQVKKAIHQLEKNSRLKTISSLYQSKPLSDMNQPDYINAVAEIEVAFSAMELLDWLQELEFAQGRIRTERWGARTLDLDIILFNQECINHERLIIPHPGVYEREFWLYPLCEIAPHLVLPKGEAVAELKEKCHDKGMIIIESRMLCPQK